MTQITLTLLGSFNVVVDGCAVTGFATDKVRALLTFLAVEHGRPHRREALAGLLWPEIADSLALSNLRQTIHRLRETLLKAVASQPSAAGDDLLIITRQTIHLNQSQWVVDVTDFEALLLACTTHDHAALALCDACLVRLTQLVTLYQGELLAGFGLWDAPAFEEWLLLRRERLHHQVLFALNHLTLAHEARGELEKAHHYAMRQLALDPYREEAHRQAMRLLAQRGLTQQALAQYEAYCRLLREEVGIEPNVETVTLVEQIRSGIFDKVTKWQGDKVTESPSHPVTLSPLTLSPPHPVTT